MGRRPDSGRRETVPERPPSPPRRRALVLLGATVGGLAVAGSGGWVGCSRPDEASVPPGGGVRVPQSELPPGSHLQVRYQGFPVHLRRAEDGTLTALSLLCTHTGCTVDWQPDVERYHCPCHEGLYDASGEVLAGPPPRPLREVPVRLEGDEIVVGGESEPA